MNHDIWGCDECGGFHQMPCTPEKKKMQQHRDEVCELRRKRFEELKDGLWDIIDKELPLPPLPR